jgi:hypothetical protein
MHVNVKNGLPGFLAIVEDQPIMADALFVGYTLPGLLMCFLGMTRK